MNPFKLFHKAKYAISKKLSPKNKELLIKTSKRVLASAEDAAYAQYVDGPMSEALSRIASATSELTNAFEKVDHVAARLGPLLYVKYTVKDKTYVRAETISPEISRLLAARPDLLSSPARLVRQLDIVSKKRLAEQKGRIAKSKSKNRQINQKPTEIYKPKRKRGSNPFDTNAEQIA